MYKVGNKLRTQQVTSKRQRPGLRSSNDTLGMQTVVLAHRGVVVGVIVPNCVDFDVVCLERLLVSSGKTAADSLAAKQKPL